MNVEILIENSRGVFGGQVGQDNIYEGAHVYRCRVVPGGFLVGSLIICVRLRASSLDCQTAEVISISQFSSPNRTNSEDRWGAINSHMVSRAQLGAKGGSIPGDVRCKRLNSGEIHF